MFFLHYSFNRDYYVEQPVVRYNHFITAIGSAFIDFAIEVADYLRLIGGEEEKIQLEEGLLMNYFL